MRSVVKRKQHESIRFDTVTEAALMNRSRKVKAAKYV